MTANARGDGGKRDCVDVKVRYFNGDAPPELKQGDILTFGEPAGVSLEEYKRRRHLVTKAHDVTVVDARKVEGGLGSWKLDTHGVTCLPSPLPISDFHNRKLVREEYYPRLLEMAKKANPTARHAVLFQHVVRVENPVNLTMAYAKFAHTDAGPDSVPIWRRLLVDEGVPEEEAMSCHICMVNIWHPIDRVAYKDPLCLLDASSFSLGDAEGNLNEAVRYRYVTSTENRTKDPTLLEKGGNEKAVGGTINEALDGGLKRTGTGSRMMRGLESQDENGNAVAPTLLGPTYSPKHRWIYCPDMKPGEAWMFKQYDTRGGVPKMAFHNSFHDPFHDKWADCPARRSIEARILLTFPADSAPFSKL